MPTWSAFIFREEVYQRDREDLRGLAELIVAKQRNGPVGTVNLVFLHAQTKFENRAEDAGPDAGRIACGSLAQWSDQFFTLSCLRAKNCS